MTKFVFVTGGVVSSLGKGITAASLGVLLKKRGFKVNIIKMDPYINVDAGTMSPFQHGEVFVTDDGAETDLDLGHYERFLDQSLAGVNSCTTGKVYSSVIRRERAGDYDGGCVQVIPHVTDAIQEQILDVAKDNDVVIAEIGGTVGDIEGQPFLEAIRQFPARVGRGNVLYCHVTLVPFIAAAGELKTKPTQHSVGELRRIGIQPDVIVCRSQYPVKQSLREKIALFCSVPVDCVIEELDSPTIYQVPQAIHDQGFDAKVLKLLGMRAGREPDLSHWDAVLDSWNHPTGTVRVALVGKYTDIRDAYLSVNESLYHAAMDNHVRVEIVPIESESLESGDPAVILAGIEGIVVPGGFGNRGIEGMIIAAQYAREHKIPYLGLCLGMQVAAIEFARHVLKLPKANSLEFDSDTPDPVINLMKEQRSVTMRGGTMRLGAYPCDLTPGTKAHAAYACDHIEERHRHRFEFNNAYEKRFSDAGMIVAGRCPTRNLVEIMEIENHPWFVGVQFHPEFKSRPVKPQPLFKRFIKAALMQGKS